MWVTNGLEATHSPKGWRVQITPPPHRLLVRNLGVHFCLGNPTYDMQDIMRVVNRLEAMDSPDLPILAFL